MAAKGVDTAFLHVEMTEQEAEVFDKVAALLPKLVEHCEPTDEIRELTLLAHHMLHQHPSYNCDNLVQLCEQLVQTAAAQPELREELYPYIKSVLIVVLFIQTNRPSIHHVSKSGQHKYTLVKVADAMLHLQEL